MEEKLYDMIKESMHSQQESIKYLSDVVNKITESQEQTMLLLDETNRRTQEHADKESANWRNAIICCIFIICLMFSGIVLIYFLTPFQVSSEATATSTSISNSESYSNDNENLSQELELLESDGD